MIRYLNQFDQSDASKVTQKKGARMWKAIIYVINDLLGLHSFYMDANSAAAAPPFTR